MKVPTLLAVALSFLPETLAAETLLGVYIYSRHGDRTPKTNPPATLTNLGYSQMLTSGSFFRSRYITSSAPSKILSINSDIVKNSQLSVSAPDDLVLMNAAQGFLQGLYPPIGPSLASQTPRNGSTIEPPLNGYQLIPVHLVTSGAGSEDKPWLQGAHGCAEAALSSNAYYSSKEFLELQSQTADLYTSIAPLVNGTFSGPQVSYKNAYTSTPPTLPISQPLHN